MGTEYRPKYAQTLNPMPRKEFQAMDLRDQSRFCLRGGTVYDEPEAEKAKEEEVMTFSDGRTITRTEWERLPIKDQAEFVMGK
jgi:hypothetical protein